MVSNAVWFWAGTHMLLLIITIYFCLVVEDLPGFWNEFKRAVLTEPRRKGK